MIYVELIELKFCELNKNIKKTIAERGKKEAEETFDNIILDEDEDEDGNNNEKEDNLELVFSEMYTKH